MHGTSGLVVNKPRALVPQELSPRLLSSEKMAEGAGLRGVTPRVLSAPGARGLTLFQKMAEGAGLRGVTPRVLPAPGARGLTLFQADRQGVEGLLSVPLFPSLLGPR